MMLKCKTFLSLIVKRSVHQEIRSKLKEKSSPKKLALEYFDFYYSSTFQEEWHGMRLAMLTGQKHMALVNNYSNLPQTLESLQKQTAIDVFNHISKQNCENKSFDDIKQKLKIPPEFKVYSFDTGETRRFKAPIRDPDGFTDTQNYYCMDGASLLPVLALGIEKDDTVLDLCASPGGKSLAILQTMLIGKLQCRDISESRLQRLTKMLKSYIPAEDFDKLVSIELNGGFRPSEELFDKVLVDVPCTNDRMSLFKEENNIFARNRTEERSNIPNIQKNLLIQAIKSCKPNGTIVYSTCSLSPIQNEGVVKTVLDLFDKEGQFKVEAEPLDYFKEYFDYFFKFSKSCKLGLLVAPDIKKNFGPFYLCKINKSKI